MLLSFSSKVKASTRRRLEITLVKGIVGCYTVIVFGFLFIILCYSVTGIG